MIKLRQAKTDTVIPLTICILSSSIELFMQSNFVIAMEKEYKGLKGIVSNDYLDEATFDLLDSLDNEVALLVKNCIKAIYNCIDSLSKLHSVKLKDIYGMEHIARLADGHLALRVLYNNDVQNHEDSLINLKQYTWSFTQIIYDLCQMVIIDEEQLPPASSMQPMFSKDTRFDYLTNSNEEDVRILSQLGSEVNEYYEELIYIINNHSVQ